MNRVDLLVNESELWLDPFHKIDLFVLSGVHF